MDSRIITIAHPVDVRNLKDRDDHHWHVCPFATCGHAWNHHNVNAGRLNSHVCPKCHNPLTLAFRYNAREAMVLAITAEHINEVIHRESN